MKKCNIPYSRKVLYSLGCTLCDPPWGAAASHSLARKTKNPPCIHDRRERWTWQRSPRWSSARACSENVEDSFSWVGVGCTPCITQYSVWFYVYHLHLTLQFPWYVSCPSLLSGLRMWGLGGASAQLNLQIWILDSERNPMILKTWRSPPETKSQNQGILWTQNPNVGFPTFSLFCRWELAND